MKTRIIHFSDTHQPATLEHWHALFDKRLVGLVNSNLIRKGRYDQSLPAKAIEYILKNPPDLAVFTGDATSCGQVGEFSRALRLFRPLLKSDIPFIYTPGNHDAYVPDRACRSALERFTLVMSRGKHPLSGYPFALDFPSFRLLVIDCARPFNPALSCGYMPPKTRQFLLDEAAKLDARPLICVGHFPLITEASLINARRLLYGSAGAAEMLQEGIIDLSLCGHIHRPYELLNERGRGEIVAGSLTKYGTLAEIIYDSDSDKFTLRRINLLDLKH
ncbi:MAG: metallophosphoesterase [Lentisphaeria bacterium]|nr:metallophosphoesterase [Lentisphaeria bacterium]